ncbi:MAG: hypothetical protein E6Q33_11055 [Neisseriales bacterium]|nr:MAG: hypothetical protein E6Q33_11055 [Neisseriales bacterium]
MCPTGEAVWTSWLDRDNPSGNGDYETLNDFLSAGQACKEPLDLVCETLDGVPADQTGQNVIVDPAQGCICVNANQNDQACLDYRVKFLCC